MVKIIYYSSTLVNPLLDMYGDFLKIFLGYSLGTVSEWKEWFGYGESGPKVASSRLGFAKRRLENYLLAQQ